MHAHHMYTYRWYLRMHAHTIVSTHTDRIYRSQAKIESTHNRIYTYGSYLSTHNCIYTYWSYLWIDTINRIYTYWSILHPHAHRMYTYGSYLHTHAHTIISTHTDRIYTRTHTQSYLHILIASTNARTHNCMYTYWSYLHTYAHTIVSTHTNRIYRLIWSTLSTHTDRSYLHIRIVSTHTHTQHRTK